MEAKKVVKWGLIGLVVILVLIQFIPVDRTNPPVTAEINAPEQVMTIFRKSCYDCHSNETDWRWYTYIAPVSWLTASDVHEGRGHVNFSEWGNLPLDKQAKKTEKIWEEVEKDGMPLKIYVLAHPGVALTPAEKETIKNWSMASGATEPEQPMGETGESEEGHSEKDSD